MNKDKCFIYARAQGKEANLTINSQIKELKKLAKKSNLEVEEIFIDIGSANDELPKRSEMFGRIFEGEVKNILCLGADRLTRSLEESYALMTLIKNYKVRLVTPSMSFDDTNESRQLITTMATLNDHYKRQMSQNIKRGIERRRRLKRFYYYRRLSSGSQLEKVGEDEQLKALEVIAGRLGYRVIKEELVREG